MVYIKINIEYVVFVVYLERNMIGIIVDWWLFIILEVVDEKFLKRFVYVIWEFLLLEWRVVVFLIKFWVWEGLEYFNIML